jgi:hypothetical protein
MKPKVMASYTEYQRVGTFSPVIQPFFSSWSQISATVRAFCDCAFSGSALLRDVARPEDGICVLQISRRAENFVCAAFLFDRDVIF